MSTLKQRLGNFFRLSDLPLNARSALEKEGLLFVAEKVRISVVYHRLKAPGRSFRNKRETTWGSLAISNKRIVGFALRKKIIHLPFKGCEAEKVKFFYVHGKVLVIAFDPGVFNPKQSGSMEIRYHFYGAQEAYGLIRDLLPQS